MTIPSPLRGEAVNNPFYSAQHLAEALGARTQWRKTLGELPPSDAVMVLSNWNWSLIEQRRQQLERWVESGGRLVIDETFTRGDARFEQWSGLVRQQEFGTCRAPVETGEADTDERAVQSEAVDDEESDDAETAETQGTVPPPACGELHVTIPAGDAQRYAACTLDQHSRLRANTEPTWSLAQDDRTQAMRVSVGRGSVTMINATPFGNRELIEADHGLLFAAATQMRPQTLIVFLSEEEYASLLELIWMYGAPALLLALLLLAAGLWRNGARFGPPAATPEQARRSLAEQIVGTGQFAVRVGDGKALHAAVVRALHDALRKRIPGYASMSAENRVAKIATLTAEDPAQLAGTVNYTGSTSCPRAAARH